MGVKDYKEETFYYAVKVGDSYVSKTEPRAISLSVEYSKAFKIECVDDADMVYIKSMLAKCEEYGLNGRIVKITKIEEIRYTEEIVE